MGQLAPPGAMPDPSSFVPGPWENAGRPDLFPSPPTHYTLVCFPVLCLTDLNVCGFLGL